MKPVTFKESNIEFAKNQNEYLTLPVFKNPTDTTGEVISCWQLSFRERLKILFTGVIWLRLLTFNKPLQPQRLTVDTPFENNE